MKRREFATLMVGATATRPLAARSHQAGKLPTIGFLGTDESACARPDLRGSATGIRCRHINGEFRDCRIAFH